MPEVRRTRMRRQRPVVERHPGYRVVVGGPVPRGADGITFGRTVIVRRSAAASRYLRLHERVHVEQYATLGVPGFLLRYGASYLAGRLRGYPHPAAYRRIPLEVEADWIARRVLWESRGTVGPDGGPPPVDTLIDQVFGIDGVSGRSADE